MSGTFITFKMEFIVPLKVEKDSVSDSLGQIRDRDSNPRKDRIFDKLTCYLLLDKRLIVFCIT